MMVNGVQLKPEVNIEVDGQEEAVTGPTADEPETEACKLFLGGLTGQTTEMAVREFYGRFGDVVDCVVMRHPHTGTSRCFGFVTFAVAQHADDALANLPHVIDSRAIDAKKAIPKEAQRREGRLRSESTGSGTGQEKYEKGRLFVAGVQTPTHTEANVRQYFEQFGQVAHVALKSDKMCAFVDFSQDEHLQLAIRERSHYIEGLRCDVQRALTREEMQRNRLQQTIRDRSVRYPRAFRSTHRPYHNRYGGYEAYDQQNYGYATPSTAASRWQQTQPIVAQQNYGGYFAGSMPFAQTGYGNQGQMWPYSQIAQPYNGPAQYRAYQ